MDPRQALQQLIDERGEDYSGLSRLLGRNVAYVQQFIRRGVPKRLPERERQILARYFDVPEAVLGGPEAEAPPTGLVEVPRFGMQAAAGAGAVVGAERPIGHVRFDAGWLRSLGASEPRHVSLIEVVGDSMAPTLAPGDDVLIDRSPAARRLRDGIYVLRSDDLLIVKRVAVAPGRGTIAIRSDNPAYPDFEACPIGDVDPVGRVIGATRRLG
ncbi:MAG TPA: S24 family peptidase [Allosphingosinicella sp.]|jgi:hypothetical protein